MFNLFKKPNEQIKTNQAIGYGVAGGIAEAVYVALVVTFLSSAENFLPNFELNKFFAPMLMLLIFVISAGLSGLAVFGYPAYLALQKNYKNAAIAAVSALVTLVVVGLLVAVVGTLV